MTPFDQYRQIRDQQIEGGPGLRLPRHPFVNIYQPLQALRALMALPELRFVECLALNQSESGEAPLCVAACWPAGRFPNLAVSCQLALLWTDLARRLKDDRLADAGKRLTGFLSPMIAERLTTLWTPEREYREEETALSCNLLLRSMGKDFNPECFDAISEQPFFSYLHQSDLRIEPEKEVETDVELGYTLIRKDNVGWAYTSKGWHMPAGAIRIAEVEIPAFGPHRSPLSDPLMFGIGPGDNQWFSSFAAKECWFCIEPIEAEERQISFILHSAGVSLSKPLSFAFYIRADECAVGNCIYKPNSLQRFCQEAKSIDFSSGQTKISLSVDRPLTIEVIPLAGDSGFWGAKFLAAFWLPPFHSKTHFRIG